MQFTTATIAAAAAFFFPTLVSAHLRMVGPASVFAANDGQDQFPLNADGSNFPCFVTTGSSGPAPVFEPGSSQSINLIGSAVHGGGSCQVSFTYDNPPTKNSVFRVVKSFQGKCPIDFNDNLPANPDNVLPPLPFTVPSDLPAGDAVVAWTWFNNIGNREMYMRCAPVTIGGSNTDTSAFDALPEILKANIGNGCSTPANTNIRFPNPGPDVVGEGNADPVGNCGPSGPAPPPSNAPILVEQPEQPPVQEQPPAQEQPPVQSPPASPSPPSGSCVDGSIVCVSATEWAICNFGVPQSMGAVAAGTSCVNGQLVAAKLKRSVRFSADHMRRRHHS